MAILANILRIVFAWLDGVVVIIISKLYELIIDMSNLILTSDNIVKVLGKRIGLILGIFMLFRIAITLINYLISPDKVSDSSKGGGKLIFNILFSIVLLVLVNHIFNLAYRAQIAIVDSNIIGKIFFGVVPENSNSGAEDDSKASIGNSIDISYYLYSSFFTPNVDKISELAPCSNIWDLSTDFVNSDCDTALQSLIDSGSRESIVEARNNMDMSQVFFNYSLVLASKDLNTVVFDYIPILSTAIGVLAILILINFNMDLAVRAVKLLFLQIIAPIPIISNMDPGKGKDIFQKWYKECFSTYLGVFIRLIAINFAVFMISLLYGNDEFANILVRNKLINVLIIIGCLMFAKQVPKLIENMFGIKSDGFVLNPMKKFQDQALFGKNIAGFAAGLGVGAIGAATGAGRGRFLGGALGGLVSGKGFGETWKNQVSANDRLRTGKLNGSTFFGRLTTQITGAVGARTPLEQYDKEIHGYDQRLEDINKELEPIKNETAVYDRLEGYKKALEERAEKKILEGKFNAHGGTNMINAKNKIETLKASAASIKRSDFAAGHLGDVAYASALDAITQQVTQAEVDYANIKKTTVEDYVTKVAAGTQSDDAATGIIGDYNQTLEINKNYSTVQGMHKLDSANGYSTLDRNDVAGTTRRTTLRNSSYGLEAEKSSIENKKRELQAKDEYRRANANKSAIGK